MGKYIKRSKNKKFSRKISLKDIIAGAFSPTSASVKIQTSARNRLKSQSNKRQYLDSLFSQGAAKYKKALQELDFRGINLDNQVLSRRVLDGANFEKVSFKKTKLNGCKLSSAKLNGAIFNETELKNIKATHASMKDCKFSNVNLTGSELNLCNLNKSEFNNTNFELTKLTNCNLDNCKFSNVNLEKSNFINCNLKNITMDFDKLLVRLRVNKINLEGSTIDNVTINNNLNIFKSLNNVTNTIKSLILSSELKERVLTCIISDKIFIDCVFGNILLDDVRLNNCEFKNCEFLDESVFFRAKIDNCKFINCNFKNFRGHSSRYINCVFKGCDLKNIDFRSCAMKDIVFSDCTLNNSDFTNTHLINATFDTNTTLFQSKMIQCKFSELHFSENVNLQQLDFQSSTGLENSNFDRLNMEAARLTGVVLNGSTFRGTNLRGVQFDFSEIYGCNFTGANLQNANVNIAEGRYEAIGIPDDQADIGAVDTHKTFYSININALIDFYKKHSDINMSQKYSDNDALIDDTLTKFRAIVSNSDFSQEERIEILEGLMKCYQGRLDTFDFERIIAGTEPRINFRDLIYISIKYLDKQPKEFKELYLQFFIYDSTNAHGQGGLSCAPGIVERLITIMSQAAAPLKDSISSKQEEYQELIHIISNDPHALMITYNQDWFDYHRDSKNPFPEDASPEVIINDFIKFMKMKFKYDEQNSTQKKKLEKVIMEHDLVGVEKLKEMIDGEYLFFAEGLIYRSKKYLHNLKKFKPLNIFKLLRTRFDFNYIKSKDNNKNKGKNKNRGKNKSKKNKKAGNVNRANTSRSALLQKNIKHLITLKKEERLRRSRRRVKSRNRSRSRITKSRR